MSIPYKKSLEDIRLVQGLEQNDSTTIAALLSRIRTWITKWGGVSWTDAEELAGDTVVRAWQKISNYRGDAPFLSWLRSIARNVYVDYLRLRCREQLDPHIDEKIEEITDWETELLLKMELEDALNKLSADHHLVILLRFRDGLNTREIAKRLSRTEDGAKSLLKRALKELRLLYGVKIDIEID
jgi:RNA polymerase sigma-70 factor, ECF subfamily